MNLWPGDAYLGYRYDYSSEYVRVMNDLWTRGVSDFKGRHLEMTDCKLTPKPSGEKEIVGAGQSDRGMQFVAEFGDYNFVTCGGVDKPTQHAPTVAKLVEAARRWRVEPTGSPRSPKPSASVSLGRST